MKRDEVRIFRCERPPRRRLEALSAVLSQDELERARASSFRADADRFVAGRVALRQVLGGLLRQPPASLRFEYGAHGRPELEGRPLRFSLAHARKLCVIAVTATTDIGVDAEPVRAGVDWKRLAARYLSSAEQGAIDAMAPARRRAAFFAIWTRKEAYLKARGLGLSAAELDAVDTWALPYGWSLVAIDLGSAIAGSLAVRLRAPRIVVRAGVRRKP